MPRDINGNFTLDTSNPVSPGTIIESDWANPTLADIAAALTDSLSRSGSGGMLAPFKFADGTKVNPASSWVNEPTSGWYRAGAKDFRYAILNNDILKITDTGVSLGAGITFDTLNAALTGLLQIAGVTQFTWDVTKLSPVAAFDNLRDLGALASRWRTGYFGTSVVTPLLDSGGDVALAARINAATRWSILNSAGAYSIVPAADNANDIGTAAARVRKMYPNAIAGAVAGATPAAAGEIGELISSSLPVGSQLALTSAAAKTITSINLTAGDWDVDGVLHFNYGPTDNILWIVGSTSSVTNVHGPLDATAARAFLTNPASGTGQINSNQQTHRLVLPRMEYQLNAPLTIFLVAQANFTGGYACHGKIRGRRVR